MSFSGWYLEPESNRHAPVTEAADFKSAVSTNFTIEACGANVRQNSPGNAVDGAVGRLEARAGVEPTYTDLQSGA
jgi:hypothetical protein